MTSRERVLNSLARKGYDRIPVKHEGTPEINQALLEHFDLANIEQLRRIVGDDFRPVEPTYVGPELKQGEDGSMEGYWGERYSMVAYDGGAYPEATYLPFAGVETLDQLDRSHFPSADWFDFSTIKDQCEHYKNYAICYGTAGDLDFINGISRIRGMEEVLMDLATDNEVFLEIMEHRFRFYYDMHERALQAADGRIHICHVGEDLGSQRGPMISMPVFEKHFAPRFGAFFDMVHKYGAKTMMHMCGCVEAFLPRLIELGLDIQDVVQPTTPGMDIAALRQTYGDGLNWCGSMCVQTTLPDGTPDDVANEVKRRQELFPKGGLFLGPTHAIQVRTPIENILAMYRTAGSLTDTIDDTIRNADCYTAPGSVGSVSRSKLF